MSKDKTGITGVEAKALPEGSELTIGENKVQLDHQGNFVGATAFGNVLAVVDGEMRITRPDGSVMIINETGGVTIQNLMPKSVGIQDLSKVESYVVQEKAEGVVHRVDFVGGGHLEATYTQTGAFVKLSGNNIVQSINNDNEILVSQGNSASGPVH